MMLFECDLGITSNSIRIGCERLQESLNLCAHALVSGHILRTPSLIHSVPHLHDPQDDHTFRTFASADYENTVDAK